MDLATIVGLVGAFSVIMGSILLGPSAGTFMNIPSLLIVIGGTIMAVLIKFPMSKMAGTAKVAVNAFFHKPVSANDLIEEGLELASVARKGGLLALEGQEISNDFLKKGIQMCVDGQEPELVKRMLSNDINQTIARHDEGRSIFKAIGDVAPAMGMIGTLIGLVQMLSNMDDPKSIGPAMAVALLTTLYGAVIANIFALPIADKLGLRSREEKRNKALILEAIGAIQEGLNPRTLEDLLSTYLPNGERGETDKAA